MPHRRRHGTPRGQEAEQEQELTAFTLLFTMTGRQQIELAAGGNRSATKGVRFSAFVASSARPTRCGPCTAQPAWTLRPTCTA